MSTWCLNQNLANDFLKSLRDGRINPDDLTSMDSKTRKEYISKIVGDKDAAHVNALFESKLLLKNQQKGIITWAQQMAGLKPEVQRDIISKVNKMTEAMNPANEKGFLNDYVDYKLGTHVTDTEAKQISEFAKIASEKKEAMSKGGDRFDYGYARVAFDNYLNELKGNNAWEKFKTDVKNPVNAISEIAGIAKSIKSTLDNSALFRQGWKVMSTHPSIWVKNSLKSFQDIARTLGNKSVMDEVRADIVSRPNYDLYVKDKVDVGVLEEQFPGSAALEKIPVLGRLHKAAENAFTAFQYRNRADLYDYYYDLAKKSDVGYIPGEGLGPLVNSLTARGNLGKWEGAAKSLNNLFFSPRLLKSHIDVLTGHAMDYKEMSPFVRKQAAVNLVKIIGGSAAILATANALKPGSVEFDPRSSDFGQIKIGATRFDVSGGMRSIITLAARTIKNSTKSSTGKIMKLGTGKYGSKDRTDVIYDFFENKLSPAASVVKDLLKGTDYQGNKITLGGEAKNLLAPLPITNYEELRDNPDSAPILLGLIADGLGISTNTYSPKKKTIKLP
jgi:hypothetical protein